MKWVFPAFSGFPPSRGAGSGLPEGEGGGWDGMPETPSARFKSGRIPADHPVPIIEVLPEGLRELITQIGLDEILLVRWGGLDDVEVKITDRCPEF